MLNWRRALRVSTALAIMFGMFFACSSGDPEGNSRSPSGSSDGSSSGEWLYDCNLIGGNGLDWQVATYSDKLATCGTIMLMTWQENYLIPRISQNISNYNDLRPYAEELLIYLDITFQDDLDDPETNRIVFSNLTIIDTATLSMAVKGWLQSP